ncbi:MAG: hypothetical protein R3C68_10770 [Myxococcota bacterium]
MMDETRKERKARREAKLHGAQARPAAAPLGHDDAPAFLRRLALALALDPLPGTQLGRQRQATLGRVLAGRRR